MGTGGPQVQVHFRPPGSGRPIGILTNPQSFGTHIPQGIDIAPRSLQQTDMLKGIGPLTDTLQMDIVQIDIHPQTDIVRTDINPQMDIAQTDIHPLMDIVQTDIHPLMDIVRTDIHPLMDIVKTDIHPLMDIILIDILPLMDTIQEDIHPQIVLVIAATPEIIPLQLGVPLQI
ncbi:MAG: hypothetical protein N0E48_00015 [Candidatus Thiodiazotropha endolucinida]|nr:hypothetical protein [Candidatus Thiodiazotropha taylori]MCW4341750.1 hypothetical protein [Candidatus Thiodiazotropha endolucinida]